jgi:UDP-2,3-diacylglucosamine hydrolase
MSKVTAAAEVVADETWRSIDFISDLHLADNTPRNFSAWRDYLFSTTADAVFILGDLFEAWVGDDARLEVGFEAHCAEVLTQASARRPIYFMVGNRDFLVGAHMLSACGVSALADPTVLTAFNQRTLLTHGDAWCLADVTYQRFRRQVRDIAWQTQLLAQPLAERRALACSIRAESERLAATHPDEWFDVDHALAQDWLTRTQSTTLVHGHTHRPATEGIAPGMTRHVLSDWELDYGGQRSQVLRWQASGWQRMSCEAASGDG